MLDFFLTSVLPFVITKIKSHSLVADSFTFDYECRDDGIQVKVISKYPYTGAMYGLYDFFTCRIEPKDDTKFEYFFPSPTISKNCSDSIRYKVIENFFIFFNNFCFEYLLKIEIEICK